MIKHSGLVKGTKCRGAKITITLSCMRAEGYSSNAGVMEVVSRGGRWERGGEGGGHYYSIFIFNETYNLILTEYGLDGNYDVAKSSINLFLNFFHFSYEFLSNVCQFSVVCFVSEYASKWHHKFYQDHQYEYQLCSVVSTDTVIKQLFC